jgi:hypothetical protein
MCQEDAYENIKVEIYDFNEYDGVIVCTDGLINPYQSISNFKNNFVNPICLKLQQGKNDEIDEFITRVGQQIGIGDDVTLGIAMKKGISLRGYK